MTRAAIYLRLSAKSKGQRNIVNLETQRADCRKLADEIGATVVGTFTEYGQSAFDRDNPDDRPQYAEMCDMMRRKEIDIVIGWHTDRLWRDDLEKALFIRDAQRAGLQLILTKTAKLDPQNPDDEFMLSILTAVAKKESADKRRRMKSKMAANARAGLAAGTGVNRPFGYEMDRVTIIPSEAALIVEMAKRLLNGATLRGVAVWANTTGATSVTGKTFDTLTVKSAVTSYRYCGLRAVGKGAAAVVVADAVWDGILDRQTVDRLRALLLDPARRLNRSARSYLLSSLLTCGRCQQRLYSQTRKGRFDANGDPLRMYVCVQAPGKPNSCGRNSVRAVELETAIAELVVARFLEMAAAGMFEPEPDTVNDGISAEIKTIDDKSSKLGADWAASKITDAAYYAASAGLVERRSQLSAMVRRNVATVPPIFTELAEYPEQIGTKWDGFDFDTKRALMLAVVDHVEISPPIVRGAHGFDLNRVNAPVWKVPRR